MLSAGCSGVKNIVEILAKKKVWFALAASIFVGSKSIPHPAAS